MYILSILLVYLGFLAASIAVDPSVTTPDGERGDFCATAYGPDLHDGLGPRRHRHQRPERELRYLLVLCVRS
jgi:hypothetical protein